jgi:hypothetical protein
MFDSAERMAQDAVKMLEVLSEMGEGRYACVVDRKHGVVLETGPDPALKAHLQEKREAIFALPDVMGQADAEPDDQLFEGFQDDFFVAVLNGRAAIVVACEAAEMIQVEGQKALEALTDRLLRMDATWRLDPKGRGLLAGRPRLDIVIAGASGEF